MIEFEREVVRDVVVLRAVMKDSPGNDGLSDVKELVSKFIGKGERKILVDLEEMGLVDSRGIGALVGCLRLARQRECLFLVCGLRPQIFETLRTLNLARVIPIRLDREEGIGLLSRTTLKPENLDLLINGNPAADTVVKYWEARSAKASAPGEERDGTSEASSRSRVSTMTPKPQPVEPAASGDAVAPVTQSTVVPAPAPAPAPEAPFRRPEDDWLLALRLFRQSAELARRHQVDFDQNTPFRELFLRLAERLGRSE